MNKNYHVKKIMRLVFLLPVAMLAFKANAEPVRVGNSNYYVDSNGNTTQNIGTATVYWKADSGRNPNIFYRFKRPVVNGPGADVIFLMHKDNNHWGTVARACYNGKCINLYASRTLWHNPKLPFPSNNKKRWQPVDLSSFGVAAGQSVSGIRVFAHPAMNEHNHWKYRKGFLPLSAKFGNYSDVRVHGFIELVDPDKGNPIAPNITAKCTGPGHRQTINIVPPASYGPDGPGTLVITQQPSNGSASIANNRQAFYTPNSYSDTPDFFIYRICDATPNCAWGRVTISCENPVMPPMANHDFFTIDGHLNQAGTFNILENDDLKGENLTSIRITSSNPTLQGGQVIIQNNQLVYTPPIGFEGNDQITYEICTAGGCDTATAVINVEGKDDGPEAFDDTFEVINGQTQNLSVLENDSFGINGRGTFRIVSGPFQGTASVNGDNITFAANGQVSTDPNNTYLCYPPQKIVYEICDNDASNPECARATATVEIVPELEIEFITAQSEDIFFNLVETPNDEEDGDFTGEKRFNDNQLEVTVSITNNAFADLTTELEFCFYPLEQPASEVCNALIPSQNSDENKFSDVVNVPAVGSTVERQYTLNITEEQRATLRALYNDDSAAQADLFKEFGLYVRDKNRFMQICTTDSLEVIGYDLPNNDFLSDGLPISPISIPEPSGLLDTSFVEENTTYRKSASTAGGEGTLGGISHVVHGEASMRLEPIDPSNPTEGGVFLNSQNNVELSVNGVTNTVSVNGAVNFNPHLFNCWNNTQATISENGAIVATRTADCQEALTRGDLTRHFEYASSFNAGTAECTLATVGSMMGSAKFNVALGVLTHTELDARFGVRYADLSDPAGPFDLVNGQFYQYLREVESGVFQGNTPRMNAFRNQYVKPRVQVVEGPNASILSLKGEVSGRVSANETITNVQDLLYTRVRGHIDLPKVNIEANIQGGMIPEGRDENGNEVIDGTERKELRGYGMSVVEAVCKTPRGSSINLEIKDLWAQTVSKELLTWNNGESSTRRDIGFYKSWPYANEDQTADNTLLSEPSVTHNLAAGIEINKVQHPPMSDDSSNDDGSEPGQCIGGDAVLSLNKPAEQSTTYGNYVAGNAVDGIAENSEEHASYTDFAAEQWWQVDLGQVSDISMITISSMWRMADLSIFVSDVPFGNQTLAQVLARDDVYQHALGAYAGGEKIVDLGCVQGRYIRVQSADRGYVTFKELTISGK